MNKRLISPIQLKPIDIVPALSGLIGKTALVSSFAAVWAGSLQITNPNFVFENVRLEMIIGSLITLIAALLLPNIAPSGTLAPFIVLVPFMAAFGVHPFLLSILVGVFGILAVKTGLFRKLLALSGSKSKTSLTLTFGISGILLSIKNLDRFYTGQRIPFILIIVSLSVIFYILRNKNKLWLMIPATATIALIISLSFGITPQSPATTASLPISPAYWWKNMWEIGYGFDPITILKTLPFAIFVIVLWAIDTVSITTMLEANQSEGQNEELKLDTSFLITSIRNMIGGFFGGAQTGALWRSFLIPLFMVKRPLRPASILMGAIGILVGISYYPIALLSFPPLVWSVLLYGIFLPFLMVGLKNLGGLKNRLDVIVILLFMVVGVILSPILTWVLSLAYEKLVNRIRKIP
jgi:hypothetical protein